MTLGLDPRQHDKLGQVIRRQEASDGAIPLERPATDYVTGTDAGFLGVPATTITAKTQSSGSAQLGNGLAWVYRFGPVGALQPWIDPLTGTHQQLRVWNLTTTQFEPSQTTNKIEPDTPLLAITQTREAGYLVSPFGETTTMPAVQLKKAYVNQSELQNNATGDIRLLQREFVIVSISKANPAVVTTAQPHGYANNDTVRIYADYSDNLLDGMKELSAWKDFSITITGANTFTIPEDTTTYTDFTTGRCARTQAETGVNRDVFGMVGHQFYRHDFIWVQQRTEDGDWDIIRPQFSGTHYAQAEEFIDRQEEGNGRLEGSNVRCRIRYEWIAPGQTQLASGANVSVFYWKTVPIEDGGVVGRPYVFRVANANCDNILDVP